MTQKPQIARRGDLCRGDVRVEDSQGKRLATPGHSERQNGTNRNGRVPCHPVLGFCTPAATPLPGRFRHQVPPAIELTSGPNALVLRRALLRTQPGARAVSSAPFARSSRPFPACNHTRRRSPSSRASGQAGRSRARDPGRDQSDPTFPGRGPNRPHPDRRWTEKPLAMEDPEDRRGRACL